MYVIINYNIYSNTVQYIPIFECNTCGCGRGCGCYSCDRGCGRGCGCGCGHGYGCHVEGERLEGGGEREQRADI